MNILLVCDFTLSLHYILVGKILLFYSSSHASHGLVHPKVTVAVREQRSPDFTVCSNSLKFLLGDPQLLPGQLKKINKILPVGPGLTLYLPP